VITAGGFTFCFIIRVSLLSKFISQDRENDSNYLNHATPDLFRQMHMLYRRKGDENVLSFTPSLRNPKLDIAIAIL
jgi:hypothetical protein